MVASGNTDLIPVFWIRIYGVLADISDQVDKTLASMKDLGVMDRPNRDATAGLRVRNAIDNLAATYESDELVYLQYRRHVECHPLQSAYRLRPTAKGLDDKVHHRLLDKALSVEDTEEALRRIIVKHRMEHAIALNFAQRAINPMDEIEAASPAWFGPPP